MSVSYTEDARRVIFTARAQAMQYGSAYIESEHLFLAILLEGEAQAGRLFGEGTSVELLRKEIEKNLAVHESVSGSVEIPLTAESKQILNVAFEEANELGHKRVGLEHLLLGILQIETCLAAKILYKHGATIPGMRKKAIRSTRNPQ
jgi:ATP-dependent Clp protease ATP-binding subunit ClpC